MWPLNRGMHAHYSGSQCNSTKQGPTGSISSSSGLAESGYTPHSPTVPRSDVEP